jgi:hypothetical protein
MQPNQPMMPSQPSERAFAESKYRVARAQLLMVTAFTLLNIILAATNADIYMLFTAEIPYFLTAVGLLPIAVAGIDIDAMMKGAADACELYRNPDLTQNDCYRYAAVRNALYAKNKTIEIMVNYEPSLHFLTEWWKQLFGESEGKDHKGIFPAAADFSSDLHSMGQYIQDGLRNIFETVINFENPRKDIVIKKFPNLLV